MSMLHRGQGYRALRNGHTMVTWSCRHASSRGISCIAWLCVLPRGFPREPGALQLERAIAGTLPTKLSHCGRTLQAAVRASFGFQCGSYCDSLKASAFQSRSTLAAALRSASHTGALFVAVWDVETLCTLAELLPSQFLRLWRQAGRVRRADAWAGMGAHWLVGCKPAFRAPGGSACGKPGPVRASCCGIGLCSKDGSACDRQLRVAHLRLPALRAVRTAAVRA